MDDKEKDLMFYMDETPLSAEHLEAHLAAVSFDANIDRYMRITTDVAVYKKSVDDFVDNASKEDIKKLLYKCYVVIGLASEVGEVAGLLKRVLRGDNNESEAQADINMEKELGDVAWYLAQACKQYGYLPSCVLYDNAKKLIDRKSRNKLHGTGDNR